MLGSVARSVVVGASVGVAMGVAVGIVVGIAVGVAVGVAVGMAVGVAVSLAVNLALGVALGVVCVSVLWVAQCGYCGGCCCGGVSVGDAAGLVRLWGFAQAHVLFYLRKPFVPARATVSLPRRRGIPRRCGLPRRRGHER